MNEAFKGCSFINYQGYLYIMSPSMSLSPNHHQKGWCDTYRDFCDFVSLPKNGKQWASAPYQTCSGCKELDISQVKLIYERNYWYSDIYTHKTVKQLEFYTAYLYLVINSAWNNCWHPRRVRVIFLLQMSH